MSRDINLTHHLGEWRKRPGPPASSSGSETAPVSGERRLRFDPFAWLAYIMLAIFLAGQFAWLVVIAG